MNNDKILKEIEQLKQEMVEMKSQKGFKGFMKKSLSKMNVLVGVGVTIFLASMILWAAQVTFTDGTVISADEVNSNFTELYNSVDEIFDTIINIPIVWKGSSSSAPITPEDYWTYYNTSDELPYIYYNGMWKEINEMYIKRYYEKGILRIVCGDNVENAVYMQPFVFKKKNTPSISMTFINGYGYDDMEGAGGLELVSNVMSFNSVTGYTEYFSFIHEIGSGAQGKNYYTVNIEWIAEVPSE